MSYATTFVLIVLTVLMLLAAIATLVFRIVQSIRRRRSR